MSKKSPLTEYYVVAVRRHYETIWRIISKHATIEEAQAELNQRRAYTGSFNYDNADLRVLSRSEAKKEFGAKWEYVPIGGVRKAVKAPANDDDI